MKKAKVLNAVAFFVGAAIGAVISAFVTDKVVEKKYWDACDKELNNASLKYREEKKRLEDEAVELRAEVSRQNVAIDVLNEKLAKAGLPAVKVVKSDEDDKEEDRSNYIRGQKEHEVDPEEREYTSYRAAYAGTDTPDEVTEEEIEVNDQEVKQRGPYIITRDQYETELINDYPKLDWQYYIWDGKVLNEDNEWMDNYASFIGEEWLEGNHRSGDVVYIRNDYYGNDYNITFVAGYGEQYMSMASGWEDD